MLKRSAANACWTLVGAISSRRFAYFWKGLEQQFSKNARVAREKTLNRIRTLIGTILSRRFAYFRKILEQALSKNARVAREKSLNRIRTLIGTMRALRRCQVKSNAPRVTQWDWLTMEQVCYGNLGGRGKVINIFTMNSDRDEIDPKP